MRIAEEAKTKGRATGRPGQRSGDKPAGPASDSCQEVLMALRRIIRATDMHSKRLAQQVGLTTPQTVVLQAVRDLGEVTLSELSRRVSLSPGTVTTILDRLEGRGLIERYRSASDRRVVHSRLTKQGRALLRKAPPLLHERFIEAFENLEPARQRRIVETLDEVAAMMGVAGLDAAPLLDTGSPVKRARD
jgi:DNA-binding MarR family transcriptional regulator